MRANMAVLGETASVPAPRRGHVCFASQERSEELPSATPSHRRARVPAPGSPAHSDTDPHYTPALPSAVTSKILVMYRSQRARHSSLSNQLEGDRGAL